MNGRPELEGRTGPRSVERTQPAPQGHGSPSWDTELQDQNLGSFPHVPSEPQGWQDLSGMFNLSSFSPFGGWTR